MEVQLDESLRRSDLPLPGDLYYYKGYEGGVVQGEVIRSYCFAEMRNPNGTWQTLTFFQDLSLTKKEVGTPVNLRGYYEDNRQLKLELCFEEVEEGAFGGVEVLISSKLFGRSLIILFISPLCQPHDQQGRTKMSMEMKLARLENRVARMEKEAMLKKIKQAIVKVVRGLGLDLEKLKKAVQGAET